MGDVIRASYGWHWLKRSIEESVVALGAVLGSIIGAAGHLGEAGPRHLVGVV